MPSTPKIAAITLQHGHWRKTADCVDSILAGDMRPAWIIVVDNASPDDSAEMIRDFLAKTAETNKWAMHDLREGETPCGQLSEDCLILIRAAKNRGYAAGNNAGLRLAQGLGAEAYLILNNDTTLERQAAGELYKRLRECEKPGLCGGTMLYDRQDRPVQCLAGGYTNYRWGLSAFAGAGLSLEEARRLNVGKVEQNLNFICGACVLASREFVEKIGLMDEGYFLYCEEQDWAIRAKSQFDFAWAKNAIIHHHEGATTGWSKYEFNWRAGMGLARSRLRLTWKHFPRYLPGVALGMLVSAFRQCGRKLISTMSKKSDKLNTGRPKYGP